MIKTLMTVILMFWTIPTLSKDRKEKCETIIDRTKHYIDIRCVKGVCKEEKRTTYLQIVQCENPDGSITERTISRED